jgi:OOP family OmpA-OmpF porin
MTSMLPQLQKSTLFLIALMSLQACAEGEALYSRSTSVLSELDKAQNPAYRCRERELAIARAQLEFMKLELEQGDYFRAVEHFEEADPNAKLAIETLSILRCLDDTDKDRIPDVNDKCVLDPEDYDQYEDTDGCPEDQDSDGDGYLDSKDLCPQQPEDFDNNEDQDGCPEKEMDRDGDGLLDNVDQCPTQPEDFDNFEDKDGCPDPDNDQDRILDKVDQCPMDPEDYDQDEDEDGCPDLYKKIELKADRIDIKDSIYFETDKDKIKPVSFSLLNEIAQILKDNPTLHISVEGHTDSQGSDQYNLDLSTRRAASVMRYLISQGIEATRLTSTGHGEAQPISDNNTEEGRATNRRVEFLITKR